MRLLALPLLLLLACAGDDERNEALLLLDRYGHLEQPTLAARKAALSDFRELALRTERVRDVQTRCGAMHAALVEAEEATEAARRATNLAEGEPALTRSAAALEEVERLRPACDQGLASLRAHHER
ncbi:MAG: hypothetical protein AAGH15_12010 [Myxococcota bacterium]